MKYTITLFLLLLFLSCNNAKEHRTSNLKPNDPILKPIIFDFFDSVRRKDKSLDFVTLYCRRKHDTVMFNIINSCPDLAFAQYYGYTNIKGHRVFCLGDTIPEYFFKISVKGKIPNDVKEKNRNVHKSNKLVISYEEPLLWSVWYKNKTQIKMP